MRYKLSWYSHNIYLTECVRSIFQGKGDLKNLVNRYLPENYELRFNFVKKLVMIFIIGPMLE